MLAFKGKVLLSRGYRLVFSLSFLEIHSGEEDDAPPVRKIGAHRVCIA